MNVAFDNMPENLEALLALQMEGRTIAEQVAEQTGVIGEKIELSYSVYAKFELNR